MRGEFALIARKSFLVFLNLIVGSVLGYVALFFILRYMGTYDYGVIGFGMAYVGLFMFISRLGFDRAHVKRVSEGKDLSKCIGTFLVIKLVLITVMICAVVGSILIWKLVIGRGFETLEHERVIYIFLAYHAVLNLSAVPLSTYTARREIAKQQLSGLMEPSIRVPLAIIIAVGSFGVIALAGSYLLGAIALFITAIVLFRVYPIGKFDKDIFKSYFKFAIPISISSSIAIINKNVDKVMIQLFWDAEAVGNYFSVQKVIIILIFMETAVTLLLFPTLSEHHGKAKLGEIRRMTRAAERYVSFIVMPIAALLIVFSWPILNLFSREVADNASTILQIMAIYSLIFCFYAIFLNQIMAIDRPGIGAKIGITIAVVNIVLNLILIPKDIKSLGITLFGLGATGAAIATTIAIVLGLIMGKIAVRRLTGTKSNPRIFLHIAAAVIMGGILYILNYYVTIKSVFVVGGACFLGLGIYLGILWLIGEFTKDDFRLFLNIMNPKEMKKYVVSELRDKEKKN